MTLHELVDYWDSHPEQQEEIMSNVLEWWNMELDEIEERLDQ